MIGAQTAEAVFEAFHGAGIIAIAILGHEEDLVAPGIHGERLAHDLLGGAVPIVPGVVEEVDAFIDGGMHHADGFGIVLDRADVPAAETHHRNTLAGAAQLTRGYAGARWFGCLPDHPPAKNSH